MAASCFNRACTQKRIESSWGVGGDLTAVEMELRDNSREDGGHHPRRLQEQVR
jgi:hypothetical protein